MSEHSNASPEFVFKVLNGALNGIEFFIGAHAYYVCTNDTATGTELDHAERTLQIPVAQDSHNLVVALADVGPDDHFAVQVCFADRQDTLQCTLNQVCKAGGLVFAVRRADDEWTDAVVQANLASTGAQALQPEDSAPASTDRQTCASVSTRHRGARRSVRQTFALVAIFVIGSLSVWYALHQRQPAAVQEQADSLRTLVGDRPGYSLHTGHDGNRYLFAPTVQQAEWVSQAVQRKRMTDAWWVVTPQAEETRLTYVLERNNIAFYAIRFNDPETPSLLLSRNRNQVSEQQLAHIRTLLLDAMPYARDVHIELLDDSDVLNRAQQGLRALGFNFQTVRSESGVTLSTWMPAADVHLTEFSRYVTQFYQTWGRRYVHFSADISEDVLKDKSYKYGDDGYVSLSRSHWMFNHRVE